MENLTSPESATPYHECAPALLSLDETENEVTITRESAKGDGRLCRISEDQRTKLEQEDWQLIKSGLTAAKYIDADIEQGAAYSYQVTSALKYGNETYEYPSDMVMSGMGEQ